jgi:hypothetical protein
MSYAQTEEPDYPVAAEPERRPTLAERVRSLEMNVASHEKTIGAMQERHDDLLRLVQTLQRETGLQPTTDPSASTRDNTIRWA